MARLADNPTVDLLLGQPRQTVYFLNRLLFIGIGISITMLSAVAPIFKDVLITITSPDASLLLRLPALWVTLIFLLQMLQFPVRTFLRQKIAEVDDDAHGRAHIIEVASAIFNGKMWAVNHHTGTVGIWSTVAGIALAYISWASWIESTPSSLEDACIRVWRTMIFLLLLMLARIGFSLLWFWYCFIYANNNPLLLGVNRQAASEEAIAQLLKFYKWAPSADTSPSVLRVNADTGGSPVSTKPLSVTDGFDESASHQAPPEPGGIPGPITTTPLALASASSPNEPDEPSLEEQLATIMAEAFGQVRPTAAETNRSVVFPTPSETSSASPASSSPQSSCAVCLADFDAGDEVAELPCSPLHVFHSACVVPWLRMQKRCPLCTLDIDEPAAASAGTPGRDAEPLRDVEAEPELDLLAEVARTWPFHYFFGDEAAVPAAVDADHED